ncbi:hypothetical protein GGX14DRAFT_635399, partial [Mycena pura]
DIFHAYPTALSRAPPCSLASPWTRGPVGASPCTSSARPAACRTRVPHRCARAQCRAHAHHRTLHAWRGVCCVATRRPTPYACARPTRAHACRACACPPPHIARTAGRSLPNQPLAPPHACRRLSTRRTCAQRSAAHAHAHPGTAGRALRCYPPPHAPHAAHHTCAALLPGTAGSALRCTPTRHGGECAACRTSLPHAPHAVARTLPPRTSHMCDKCTGARHWPWRTPCTAGHALPCYLATRPAAGRRMRASLHAPLPRRAPHTHPPPRIHLPPCTPYTHAAARTCCLALVVRVARVIVQLVLL